MLHCCHCYAGLNIEVILYSLTSKKYGGAGIATYTAHRPESIYDLIPADLVGAIIVGTTAATAQGLVSSGKDPVVVHACASTTNPIRHIRMFDDIVTPFWTEHPAKYRFSYGYPKSTDFL